MRLLKMQEVVHMVGMGKTSIYTLINEDGFPQPIKLRAATVWVESEVVGWIEKLVSDYRANSTKSA